MHCLLLGNGLNRLQSSLNWPGLLAQLGAEVAVPDFNQYLDHKPLSLLFEELCVFGSGSSRSTEIKIKRRISALLADVQPGPLHREFADHFNVILTTNYDYAIEHAIGGPLAERASLMYESRYSLFRRVRTGAKEVWHVHGDIHLPETIVLGFDHYAGYLQKIRNYLTDGIPSGKSPTPIRSPLKGGVGAQDFEKWGLRHSWVDHFLRDHLHIVGLGLDFTEIDLWWLLLHKRRRKLQSGRTFYYTIRSIGGNDPREAARHSVLRSLGMTVVVIEAESYQVGYDCVLREVVRNISDNPGLLSPDMTSIGEVNESAAEGSAQGQDPNRGAQLKLRFRRGGRRQLDLPVATFISAGLWASPSVHHRAA